MSLVELAACLGAVAFAVLVGFLVPVLIRLRHTAAEGQLLAKMNADLPALRRTPFDESQSECLADQARAGWSMPVLLHAVGKLGESVQQVHDVVQDQRYITDQCGQSRGRRQGCHTRHA
jgi:uncharacterized protein YoxC